MLLRLVQLLLIALLAFQAMGTGTVRLVCRYTGKTLEKCCCPRPPGIGSSAELRKTADCCCDVIRTDRFLVLATEKETHPQLVWLAIAEPPQPGIQPQAEPPRWSVESPAPPGPRPRRYLDHRHLLL